MSRFFFLTASAAVFAAIGFALGYVAHGVWDRALILTVAGGLGGVLVGDVGLDVWEQRRVRRGRSGMTA
ncbi:MAG TPA: hypothetical protein VKD72_33135 [Gemmataceae bacterium]|nr:hypothetical protein [Gemmataceae bacterium]